MTAFTFLCLINGFDVFWPENWSASSFLTAYIGIPIFLCIYFGHRLSHMKEAWVYDSAEVDLHTGLDHVIAEETPPKVQKNKWLKPLTLLWE